MDKLTKISAITLILGMCILFFLFSQNFFILEGINNMTKETLNKDIFLKGEIINIYENNHSTSILMKTECFVNGIIFDTINVDENFKNKKVRVKASISSEFNPNVNIEEIYLLNQ